MQSSKNQHNEALPQNTINEDNQPNEQVFVEQAENVWKQIQKSPMSPDELDKIIPMNADFFKGLMEITNKQIESDDRQYKDYIVLIQASQNIIVEALKDGRVTSEERIEIIKVLSTLSTNIAEIEKNRKREDGKTKRTFGIIGAAFAAIAAIIIGRNA